MGDGAEDALKMFIRSGMPSTKAKNLSPVCTVCGKHLRSLTMNWTFCKDGTRHSRDAALKQLEK